MRMWPAFLMLPCVTGMAGSPSPFPVGSRAQLFADKTLVRSSHNLTFTLHPARKHPANPLLRPDAALDGWRLMLCGSVLRESDGLFRLWYWCEKRATAYAFSPDGIAWQKDPAFKHNSMFASVFRDDVDPDPARRYKMIAWAQNPPGVKTASGYGYHTQVSSDGMQWTPFSTEPIHPQTDVITGYYDRRLGLYVALPKIMTRLQGFNQRCFGVITSPDFRTWSAPTMAFVPDLRDNAGSLARIEAVRPLLDMPDDPTRMRTELYGIGVYQQESCTLAFPWIFTINSNARYGNHEGPGEVQLAVSRDLEHWDRPFRTPCILPGSLGEWDCGFFETAAEALRVGDEVWLYYAGANYTHGTPCLYRAENTGRLTPYTSCIGLAIWPLDRFVSADAPAEDGTLTTVPVVFTGQRLELNAATVGDGSIVVDLTEPSGKALATSVPLSGDSLRHRVGWPPGVAIGAWAGKPVVLTFRMKRAALYSFAFRD